jgi:hypothetical protein
MVGTARGKRPEVTEDSSDEDPLVHSPQGESPRTAGRSRLSGLTQPLAPVMDPGQFQQLVLQAITSINTVVSQQQQNPEPRRAHALKPPTYAVEKLSLDATFQQREDWLKAVEQGNSQAEGQPDWVRVQWASTWMESEVQHNWRSQLTTLHGDDFKQVLWEEFKNWVNSDYLDGDSAEVQAQKDWMACTQNGRSPQTFFHEWSSLVRRLPGMDIDSVFMARDYWLKLDRFYHQKYADTIGHVESARDCAKWCERIWLSRAASRNGLERDAHRKRPFPPTNTDGPSKSLRTTGSTYAGPRHDRARNISWELRNRAAFPNDEQTRPRTYSHTPSVSQSSRPPANPDTSLASRISRPPAATGKPPSNTTPSGNKLVCFSCHKPGHMRRDCPEDSSTEPARVQAIGTSVDDNPFEPTDYPEASDSEDDSENYMR